MAVDWNDPCAKAEALREVYMSIVSGSKAETVEYTANGVARRVTFNSVNLATLKQELETAEFQCANGGAKPRRHAITFGARRRRY